jgi:hypothetical protein
VPAPGRNPVSPRGVILRQIDQEVSMKGIIAWLLGVPIVVIILLYLFNIF